MIKPKNNSFYIKQEIDSTSAIKLSALFKDASLYENEIMTLESGPAAAKFLTSGSIPAQRVYGEGDLKGAKLVLFCSGTDLSNMGRMPSIASYKLKEDITLTEGGMAFSTSGTDLSVYTSFVDSSQPYLAETFDGIPKDMGGNVRVAGSDGLGPVMMESPYMSPEDAAKSIYLGGTYSMFHAGESNEGGSKEFMVEFFGDKPYGMSGMGKSNDPYSGGGMQKAFGGFGRMTTKGAKISVKPMNKKKPQGKWIPSTDNRKGYAVYTVFKPIWRWNDIKGLLKFETSQPKVHADIIEPSAINTAFTHLAKTPENQNPYFADLDGSPWITSELNMSSEHFRTGGQSLHMAHVWQFTDGTIDTNTLFGVSGQVNEQFSVAAGEFLPYPIPLDHALISTSGTTPYWNSASGSIASTLSKPELDISFKVTELDSALKIYSPEGASHPKDMSVFDYIGYDSAQANGTGFAYYGSSSIANWTMLRSFTVCLSSYLPNPGESLNGFIDRGMLNFYQQRKRSEGIIGGVTFLRFIDNDTDVLGSDDVGSNDNADIIIACPLLTRASAYNTADVFKGPGKGSDNPTNRMLRAVKGVTTDAGMNASVIMHPYTAYPVTKGFKRAFDPSSTGSSNPDFNAGRQEPTVALNLNQWINLKIVLDPLGENSGLNPGLGRMYFTEGAYSDVSGTATQEATYNTDYPPSLQFYFPASTNTSADSKTTYPFVDPANQTAGNWNWVDHPEYWPKYLSLWLTNYRYADPTDLVAGKQQGKDISIIIGEFPANSGSSKSSEVYIDSITLRNFTNETLNNSAGAAWLTKPVSIQDRPMKTYLNASGTLLYPESAGSRSVRVSKNS